MTEWRLRGGGSLLCRSAWQLAAQGTLRSGLTVHLAREVTESPPRDLIRGAAQSAGEGSHHNHADSACRHQ